MTKFNPLLSSDYVHHKGMLVYWLHGCIIIINVIHDGGLLFANLSTNELRTPLGPGETTNETFRFNAQRRYQKHVFTMLESVF